MGTKVGNRFHPILFESKLIGFHVVPLNGECPICMERIKSKSVLSYNEMIQYRSNFIPQREKSGG